MEEITLNHTKVTNKSGEVIYVPNKTIYSESVENLSRRRFFQYEFQVPFAKNEPAEIISLAMERIEAKINSFYPLDIEYISSNPNATDYLYTINVKLAKESKFFETEMQKFLMKYIFDRGKKSEKNDENTPIIKPLEPIIEANDDIL